MALGIILGTTLDGMVMDGDGLTLAAITDGTIPGILPDGMWVAEAITTEKDTTPEDVETAVMHTVAEALLQLADPLPPTEADLPTMEGLHPAAMAAGIRLIMENPTLAHLQLGQTVLMYTEEPLEAPLQKLYHQEHAQE